MTDDTLGRLAALHLAFAVLGALALAATDLPDRQVIWIVVVAYNISLPVYFFQHGDFDVVELWAFLLPLSLLQLVPDWYLSEVQQTLVFPTATDAAPVPLFMAGLWTFPLVMTTAVGLYLKRRRTAAIGYAAAVGMGLLVFGGGELALTQAGIWQAVDVSNIGGLAFYILPAELVLTAATLYVYEDLDWQSPWHRLAATPVIMLVYLGAATTSYLLVEQWIL